MKTQKVKISQVKRNPENPRLIKDNKFHKLVRSIKEFPEMLEIRPIVVNEDMIVLGGNMRLKACQEAGLKEVSIIQASELTAEQQREFIVKDNVGFGEWDWDMIANEWDLDKIQDWGMDVLGFNVNDEDLKDGFDLPDGEKSPFQQMTFNLADEQVEQINLKISDIKKTEEFKYTETFGNENSNGNALYLIVMKWAEQNK